MNCWPIWLHQDLNFSWQVPVLWVVWTTDSSSSATAYGFLFNKTLALLGGIRSKRNLIRWFIQVLQNFKLSKSNQFWQFVSRSAEIKRKHTNLCWTYYTEMTRQVYPPSSLNKLTLVDKKQTIIVNYCTENLIRSREDDYNCIPRLCTIEKRNLKSNFV